MLPAAQNTTSTSAAHRRPVAQCGQTPSSCAPAKAGHSCLQNRCVAGALWLNSHVVDLDVTVVGGCDQQLRVGGEGERPDGHGVACRAGDSHNTVQHSHARTSSSPSVSAGFTFQRVEQLPSGDVKDVDDSVDGAARQILSIRTLRTDGKTLTECLRDT